MVYMKVLCRSDSKLHLGRSPGLRSWATFMGIIALGLGLFVYSDEGLLWKAFWFFCTVFVAISSLDDWEEFVIDKEECQIRLERDRLMERVLMPTQKARSVVASTTQVCSVEVEQDDIRFFGRGFYVALHMNNGMVLPVTEKCTLGNSKDHQLIAELIRDFLRDELRDNRQLYAGLAGEEAGESSSSSSDSEKP